MSADEMEFARAMNAAIVSLAVFLDGILAGIFIGSGLVEQSARQLDAPSWIAYKQAKEVVFGSVMPIFFGLCLAATILSAVMSPAHLLFGIAAVSLAAAFAITVAVHLPLNKLFQTWSATDVPTGWADARQRWRQWNWVRSGFVVVAFGIALMAWQ